MVFNKPITNHPPFGSTLPTRSCSDASRSYRYGFNGKEKNSEKSYDNFPITIGIGARIYDCSIGRCLSLDPLMEDYPEISPYAFAENCSITLYDPDGENPIIGIFMGGRGEYLGQVGMNLFEYGFSARALTDIDFNDVFASAVQGAINPAKGASTLIKFAAKIAKLSLEVSKAIVDAKPSGVTYLGGKGKNKKSAWDAGVDRGLSLIAGSVSEAVSKKVTNHFVKNSAKVTAAKTTAKGAAKKLNTALKNSRPAHNILKKQEALLEATIKQQKAIANETIKSQAVSLMPNTVIGTIQNSVADAMHKTTKPAAASPRVYDSKSDNSNSGNSLNYNVTQSNAKSQNIRNESGDCTPESAGNGAYYLNREHTLLYDLNTQIEYKRVGNSFGYSRNHVKIDVTKPIKSR